MLKTVVASLLGGVLAVLAVGYLLYTLQGESQPAISPILLDPALVRTEVGSSAPAGQGIAITLDAGGRGALVWSLSSPAARQYPFLHLRFEQPPTDNRLGVFWKTTTLGQQMAQYWVNGRVASSVWLKLDGIAHWTDTVVELALLLQGEPGETVVLQEAGLHPATYLGQLRAFYSDWTAFELWEMASINNYRAVRSASPALYPVPLAGAVLCAGVLLYILILRWRRSVDLVVLAALFLVCWLSLDLVWQGKLVRQLQVSYGQFAGKSGPEKLMVGPDAALVRFMSDVRERINTPNARVFVASAEDYPGMRASYYLYPLNVYWQRSGGELPVTSYLKRGDYIVMVKPSGMRFEPQLKVLHTPTGEKIAAEPLGSSGLGSLFRVL